jgi:phosphatidylserine/phosphatidylglycerophosphate/cardiolipin synthase-like enzyme
MGFVILQAAASYAMKPGEVRETSEAFDEQPDILGISQLPAKKQKTLAEVGVEVEEAAILEVAPPVDVPGILGSLNRASQFFFVSLLDPKDKENLRLTSQGFKLFIDWFFFGPVYDPAADVQAFSSEISAGTIGSNILDLVKRARQQVVISSDKCTNAEFLDDLLDLQKKKPLEIKIVTGVDSATKRLFEDKKYSVFSYRPIPSNPDNSGKMHNKFIVVDQETVITGSPNMTYAAYNYNVESFVAIRHRFVARLYLRYYDYLTSGKNKYDATQEEYRRVKKMLDVFNNAPENPIQVALSPIWNIKSFVVKELTERLLVNINMFLVSHAQAKPDIIDSLEQACKKGAKVCIKVDGEQYKDQPYVRDALVKLRTTLKQEVYAVLKKSEKKQTKTKEITTIPQFHDKLVLLEGKDGSQKICIGSAGFTDNVQDNLNLENMVLLHKHPKVYSELLLHFQDIQHNHKNLTVHKL